MSSKHRVTISVRRIDGHPDSLTATRTVYADVLMDIITALLETLHDFPSNDTDSPNPTKTKSR